MRGEIVFFAIYLSEFVFQINFFIKYQNKELSCKNQEPKCYKI